MNAGLSIDFSEVRPRTGALGVRWIHGSPSAKHNVDEDIQVHWYDEHTVILRQNMAINYEGPFLFLLFGNERVMLIDTGATADAEYFPLRRVVDELIAGHHEAAVTFFDPWTGSLLTGDTVYPGRLYIQDWAAFTRSIDRLIEFSDERAVSHVLGCHIEMTTEPGVDYPVRTTYQPDEPPLEMTTADLREIRAAIEEVGLPPTRRAFGRFILHPNV